MSTVLTHAGVEQSATHDALSRVLGEAQSLGTDELLMPNVDLESAILTVLGAVSRAQPYLADLRELPGLRVKGIEALQDYAMALAAACVRVRAVCAPRSELPGLLARASQWCKILSSEAETLSLRGLIPPGALARVRSRLQRARGCKNVAFDLMALAQFFADAWPAIAGTTGLAATEVHDAFALGLELMEAAPKSKNASDPRAAAVDLRARVFTLLHRAYAELRQGMRYLRWREGDADRIVPSLYQRSPRPRRAARRISSPRDASADAGRARAVDASVGAARARAVDASVDAARARAVGASSTSLPPPSPGSAPPSRVHTELPRGGAGAWSAMRCAEESDRGAEYTEPMLRPTTRRNNGHVSTGELVDTWEGYYG